MTTERTPATDRAAELLDHHPPNGVPLADWRRIVIGSLMAQAIAHVRGDFEGENADADLDYAGEVEEAMASLGLTVVLTREAEASASNATVAALRDVAASMLHDARIGCISRTGDGWCLSLQTGSHVSDAIRLNTALAADAPAAPVAVEGEGLASIPGGLYSANRYDTDDELVLHVWANGVSHDLREAK